MVNIKPGVKTKMAEPGILDTSYSPLPVGTNHANYRHDEHGYDFELVIHHIAFYIHFYSEYHTLSFIQKVWVPSADCFPFSRLPSLAYYFPGHLMQIDLVGSSNPPLLSFRSGKNTFNRYNCIMQEALLAKEMCYDSGNVE